MALNIPIELDIEIPSGDDQTFEATIRDKAGLVDFDYGSYNIFFTVKNTKNEYSSDVNAIYQIKNPTIVVSTSGSPVETTISFDYYAREDAAGTATPLPVGTYYYDIQFVAPSGKPVQTWWRGKFKVTWHSTVTTV